MYQLGHLLIDDKKADNDGKDIASVMTKLKFIGTIKPKEKLDVKHLTIQKDTYWNAFWRMINQESWENTIEFFDSTYTDAFNHLSVLISKTPKKHTDQILCRNIIHDIHSSITGIRNAQTTYWYDRLIVCRLQTLIDMTTLNLTRLQEMHPDLFEQVIEEEPRSDSPKLSLGPIPSLSEFPALKPVNN
jgi:hypothetical protein